jgi:hypothetical protein
MSTGFRERLIFAFTFFKRWIKPASLVRLEAFKGIHKQSDSAESFQSGS